MSCVLLLFPPPGTLQRALQECCNDPNLVKKIAKEFAKHLLLLKDLLAKLVQLLVGKLSQQKVIAIAKTLLQESISHPVVRLGASLEHRISLTLPGDDCVQRLCSEKSSFSFIKKYFNQIILFADIVEIQAFFEKLFPLTTLRSNKKQQKLCETVFSNTTIKGATIAARQKEKVRIFSSILNKYFSWSKPFVFTPHFKPIGRGSFGLVYREAERKEVMKCIVNNNPSEAVKKAVGIFAYIFAGCETWPKSLISLLSASPDKGYLVMPNGGEDLNGLFALRQRQKNMQKHRVSENISLPILLDFMCQTLEGLAFLHKLRLIHRDIKPGNIVGMQTPQGMNFRIIDLDCAVLSSRNQQSNIHLKCYCDNDCFGTDHFKSLDVIFRKRTTFADDIFALALTILCLIQGLQVLYWLNENETTQNHSLALISCLSKTQIDGSKEYLATININKEDCITRDDSTKYFSFQPFATERCKQSVNPASRASFSEIVLLLKQILHAMLAIKRKERISSVKALDWARTVFNQYHQVYTNF